MIIKFKSKDTWVIFGEVSHVEYNDMDVDPRTVGISSHITVFDPPRDQAAIGKWVGIGFFTKNMDEPTEVIACTPIYIMNDQGKTVETI